MGTVGKHQLRILEGVVMMKVTDKIKQGRIISIEVLPPNRGHSAEDIFKAVDELITDYP